MVHSPRALRRYATARERGQFACGHEEPRGRRAPRQVDFQRGRQVHARLEAAHMGYPVATEQTFPWDWAAVGAFLLLVLGVLLWTH